MEFHVGGSAAAANGERPTLAAGIVIDEQAVVGPACGQPVERVRADCKGECAAFAELVVLLWWWGWFR